MLRPVSSAAEKVDQRRLRGRATRDQILDAAREVLRDSGYGGATMRAVADAAGVRLSLLHYHFGGKRQLFAALLEYENEQLLARQRTLFAGEEPLADKWLRACQYLGDDLRSGYVRVLWELWSAGLADPGLAERWRTAVLGWIDLLDRVAAEWASERGVDLPVSSRVVAALVAQLFLGAEVQILGGLTERQVPNFEALELCARLIEAAEHRA
jgi:AcrR family transcriptional regulator